MPKPPAPNGSAEIQALGQTATPEFGQDPNEKGLYASAKARDLKLK
jgi:hypothetical protein